MQTSLLRKLSMSLLLCATVAIVVLDGCKKNKSQPGIDKQAPAISVNGSTVTRTMSVAAITTNGSLTSVLFNENEQILQTADASLISLLQDAATTNSPVNVTYNPWQAMITAAVKTSRNARNVIAGSSGAQKIDLASTAPELVDHLPDGLGIMNATTPGLTPVIPDFTTAQQMFDYIAHQCCALSGPFTVDYCISFQYCEDGCYARAHKMCWILNNKYHYATQKIFSFANAGSDVLSVKAEKWGGCCINWWYHVAPLVTIQTPTGPKAYVFDPAMFDQPVLLSQWLHAQENPACVSGSSTAHVTMINVQPTASYCPAGGSGYYFYDDPYYADTDSTLVNYAPLVSCP